MKGQSIILIVDDQLSARAVLEGVLAGQGYQLAFAPDGPQALKMAVELIPDLILLDVMMPGMDGFEVCTRLRANPKVAEVPIIMITALGDQHSLLRGVEAGADDFLSKPFNHAELQSRVRTITRLNRYRRLLAERAKFEWVVEQAEEGYLLVNDNDEVLYANPKARLYLGLEDKQNSDAPRSFLRVVLQQYHARPPEAWANWPEPPTQQPPRYLVRPETPTARTFWLQVNALEAPFGEETVWVIRLQDVTEKLALQHDMRSFHGMIFHKLRTPLIGMITGLDLLVDTNPQDAPEETKRLAEIARRGAQRLHSEVEDILQYVRIPVLAETGHEFNLNQLGPLVKQISANLGLENVTTTGGEDNLQLVLSSQSVELILSELLENAQKFHPQQNPIVEICVFQKDAQTVQIKVSDNGLTLSPEQLTQVWTPYYQGEKFFTGQAIGMGLGLSMVASMVWSVGGECGMYNQVGGRGVVVDLMIPLAKGPQSRSEELIL